MSLKTPITTIDRLAAYRKKVEQWNRSYKAAVINWREVKSKAKTDAPFPEMDSFKPENCEPSHFGLNESHKFLTDKIIKEVLQPCSPETKP